MAMAISRESTGGREGRRSRRSRRSRGTRGSMGIDWRYGK
jgi:hypothetical protein